MTFLRSILLSMAAVLLTVAVQPCLAAAGAGAELDGYARVTSETLQSGGPSLSEAVEQVRRETGGRIISAETRRRGNREVHVIKVLTRDNKVQTKRVNGRRLN